MENIVQEKKSRLRPAVQERRSKLLVAVRDVLQSGPMGVSNIVRGVEALGFRGHQVWTDVYTLLKSSSEFTASLGDSKRPKWCLAAHVQVPVKEIESNIPDDGGFSSLDDELPKAA